MNVFFIYQSGAIALSMIAFASFPGFANTTQRSPEVSQITTTHYSVSFPSHWIIYDRSETSLILYNQTPGFGGGIAPTYMVKTDIAFVPVSLESMMQSSIEYGDGGSQRQESLTINGFASVRTWTTDASDFSNSISTCLQIAPEETACISSFYNEENVFAEPAILEIHRTFEWFRE